MKKTKQQIKAEKDANESRLYDLFQALKADKRIEAERHLTSSRLVLEDSKKLSARITERLKNVEMGRRRKA